MLVKVEHKLLLISLQPSLLIEDFCVDWYIFPEIYKLLLVTKYTGTSEENSFETVICGQSMTLQR